MVFYPIIAVCNVFLYRGPSNALSLGGETRERYDTGHVVITMGGRSRRVLKPHRHDLTGLARNATTPSSPSLKPILPTISTPKAARRYRVLRSPLHNDGQQWDSRLRNRPFFKPFLGTGHNEYDRL